MKILKTLAVLVGLIVPAVALAHGPTRQKITVTTEVAAPPEQVWAVIGNFQDMSWAAAGVLHPRSGRQRH